MIEGTARLWIEHLSQFSEGRLAVAFDAVERSATRWPVPANVIDELPKHEPGVALLERRSLTDEEREANRQRVAAIAKDLGIT